jgi:hypothetical protein
MKANDIQIDGDHYKDGEVGKCAHCGGKVEHWDWAMNLPGLEYAATKYLARWRKKGGLNSLLKVVHYVQRRIEEAFPDKLFTFSCVDRPKIVTVPIQPTVQSCVATSSAIDDVACCDDCGAEPGKPHGFMCPSR